MKAIVAIALTVAGLAVVGVVASDLIARLAMRRFWAERDRRRAVA